MITEVTFAEMTFPEILEWSREQDMSKEELDERAVKACRQYCKIFGRCANVAAKDWCDNACVSAITSWKEEQEAS